MNARKYHKPGRPPGRTGRGGNRPTSRSGRGKARASSACLLMAAVALAYDIYSKIRMALHAGGSS